MIEQFVSRHGVRAFCHLLKNLHEQPEVLPPRLAVSQRTTYRWSLAEDLAGYRRAGVGAIGIWRQKLQACGEQRGIRMIRHSGLKVSSLSWAGGFTGASGYSFVEAVQDARQAICTAAAIGADCLVLTSGPRGMHTHRNAARLLDDALHLLLGDATRFGVTLALQPMHTAYAAEWTFLNSIDSALDVVRRWNSPRLKLAFDAYHFGREADLLTKIPQLAAETAVVQLSDCGQNTASLDGNRCLPGNGSLPLGRIMQAFQAARYSGRYEMDIWSNELWQTDYVQLLDECRSRFAVLSHR